MSEIIDFAAYLTGHDEETIIQMYNDWLGHRQDEVTKVTHINDITNPEFPEPQMDYEQ